MPVGVIEDGERNALFDKSEAVGKIPLMATITTSGKAGNSAPLFASIAGVGWSAASTSRILD